MSQQTGIPEARTRSRSLALSSAGSPRSAAVQKGKTRSNDRRRKLWLAGILLVVIGLATNPGLVRDVRDQFLPKRWGVVEPGRIFRSGQISGRLIKEMLQEYRIARVVDLTLDNPKDRYHEAELAAISELGIERTLFPLISDGTGDVKIYAAAVAAVAEAERAGKPVLVHCAAGTQRTGGVIATYRLLVQKKPPREVLEEMRQYKYDPDQSPRLMAYLNEHMEELAEELVEHGTIDHVPDQVPVLHAE